MNIWATGETITAVKLNLYSQGPAGANDNAIPLFDGVTGLLTKDSGLFIDQDVRTTDSPTFAGLTLTGNLTTSGTVDGVDIAGLETGTNANLTIYSNDYLLPTALKSGFGRLKAYGKLYQNILINPTFIDGASWTPTGGAESIADNVYKNTGDGSSATVSATQDTGATVEVSVNYFFTAKVKVTGSNITKIQVQTDGTTGGTISDFDLETAVSSGDWMNIYGIVTFAGDCSGLCQIFINTIFASSGDANTATMEIDGNSPITLINLSAIGETETDEEILFNKYQGVNGTAYTESTGVKSVGKNLFNIEKFASDLLTNDDNLLIGFKDGRINLSGGDGVPSVAIDGINRTTTKTTAFLEQYAMKVKPSTDYATICADYTGTDKVWIFFYDINGGYLITKVVNTTTGTFTSDASAYYMIASSGGNALTDNTEFGELCIMEGTVATYESYRESEVIIPYVGRSIPSGQTDTTFQTEDLRWFSNQAVSSGVAYTSGTDIDTTNNPTARADGKYMLIGASFTTYTGNIVDVDTVAENGTLYFDLAKPIMSEFEYNKSLLLFENGTIKMDTDGTIPDLNVEYCTNIAEQRDKNSSAINSFMKGDTV